MANSTLLLCSLWLALALAVLGADTLYPPSYDGSWALQPPAPRAAGPYRQTTRHEIIERSFRKPFERRASSVPGVCTIPTPPGRNLAYFARAAISGSSNVAFSATFPAADITACTQACLSTPCCVMAFFRGDDSMCRTGTASDPIDYPGLAPFNFNNAFVFVGYTCDNVRSVTEIDASLQCQTVNV